MNTPQHLLLANRAWARELLEEQPDFFERQTRGQKPTFLWIGCSDSRVSPEQMTMTPPGGMFLHRNVANLVDPNDLNLMSVLQYAVAVLGVEHLIVCGHSGCGGVKAVLDGGTTGPVDAWLEPARRVAAAHRAELARADTLDSRVDRLVECNVRGQLLNLARTETVQAAFARGQALHLHGWVYDMSAGRLTPLLEIDRDTDLAGVAVPHPVLRSADERRVAAPA